MDVLDMRSKITERVRKMKGEFIQHARKSVFTPTIRNIFGLDGGGNPRLASSLRDADAIQDRISIVLNLTVRGLKLIRDSLNYNIWKDRSMCKRDLTMVTLAAKDPTVLCTLGSPLQSFDNINSDYSWLCKPAFDYLSVGAKGEGKLPVMSTNSFTVDQSPYSRWIELDALDLGQPELPTDDWQGVSAAVIAKASQLGMGIYRSGSHGKYASGVWGPGPKYQYWGIHTRPRSDYEEAYQLTLTCVFPCGFKWALVISRRYGFPDISGFQESIRFFANGFVEQDMRSLSGSSTRTGLQGVDALLRLTVRVLRWFSILLTLRLQRLEK